MSATFFKCVFIRTVLLILGIVTCSSDKQAVKEGLKKAATTAWKISKGTLAFILKNRVILLQTLMKTGLPALNIPVLDPFVLPKLEINVTEDMITAYANHSDSQLTGLSNFHITKFRVYVVPLGAEFGLSFPEITLHGHYFLDSKVHSFPVRGKGPYSVLVKNLYIEGSCELTIHEMKTILVDKLNLHVQLGKFNVNFKNLNVGGKMVKLLVNTFAKKVFNLIMPKVTSKLTDSLRTEMNGRLGEADIKQLFTQQKKLLNVPGNFNDDDDDTQPDMQPEETLKKVAHPIEDTEVDVPLEKPARNHQQQDADEESKTVDLTAFLSD